MLRGRNTGPGRGQSSFGSPRRVPLKGLFKEGVWHCNCEPRLPAEHFQTKNGGKNHGRWFYTCQKPQHTRCGFFLWDDEAKPREAATVLNNSRSESIPVTPTKRGCAGEHPKLLDDRSSSRAIPGHIRPSTPSPGSSTQGQNGTSGLPAEESFEWPASDEEEIINVVNVASATGIRPPETPRKAIKTDKFGSPGKRRYEETEDIGEAYRTPDTGDVFVTPTTGVRGKNLFSTSALLSPAETPTPHRHNNAPVGVFGDEDEPELIKDVLDVFRDLAISLDTKSLGELKAALMKHVLKTRGVAKGRDISRLAIKSKDAKIEELQARIAALEAERETNRAVIRHLRRDIGATVTK